MPTKLTPGLCYLAGIVSKTRQGERSMVGINTTIDDVVENFVEVALKMGIDTKKIMIEDVDGVKHVYFFHSKLAKQIREIVEKQTRIFKYNNEFSASFLAGMFDSSGKISRGKLLLSGMSTADQVVLENLGIHTHQNSITNIKAFLDIIKEKSVIFKMKMG